MAGDSALDRRDQGEGEESALSRVNRSLAAELDRIEAIGLDSPDELRLEISRSKAVEGICRALTDNTKAIMDGIRMHDELAGRAKASVRKVLAG